MLEEHDPDMIQVHNATDVMAYLAKQFPDKGKILYMHNEARFGDPKTVEGVQASVQNRKPWPQIGMDDALPLGRPCFVGREGVIDSIELELSDLECAALRSSLVRLRRLSEDWFVDEPEKEPCRLE